jgi:uncharacterized protein YcbK (DUF882 family)
VIRTFPALVLLLGSSVALAQPTGKSASPRAKGASRYATQVRTWHASVDGPVPIDDSSRPLLVLVALNTGERLGLRAATERGGFAASDLDRVATLLRDTRTGNSHPVEPRLVDLVYDLETHFQSREIRVLSGYRTPRARSGSNHGKGRAIDLVVPGTSDEEAAAYARTLGFVGVGIYPTSGFIHVDVREKSYFWSDSSGPGRRNRERGILAPLAVESDRAARQRGTMPPSPFGLLHDVDAVIGSRGDFTDGLDMEEDLESEDTP